MVAYQPPQMSIIFECVYVFLNQVRAKGPARTLRHSLRLNADLADTPLQKSLRQF